MTTIVRMPRFQTILTSGFLIAIYLAIQPVSALAQTDTKTQIAASSERTLRIGRVSGNPRKHAGRLQRLGEYVVARHEAFDDVKVVLTHKPAEMVEAVGRGEIDLISETVFTALQIESTGKMEVALLEWKDGVRNYHGAILVRADSKFERLEDLKGARIAFEDPGSTSGYFLPYLEIMDAGLKMTPDTTSSDAFEGVRYIFGGAELNVIGSLIRGHVDAAAISNLDMDDDEVVTARFKPALRLLHETREVPRSLMMMRSSLPQDVRDRVSELLLSLHETDEGQAVLRRYFRLKQFDQIDATSRAHMDRVRNAFETHRPR